MRRRWFALISFTALLFPSYPCRLMNVIIQKLNGLWHLIVGSCQIRTPFLETQDRALVVAYARRVYPGAKILERD